MDRLYKNTIGMFDFAKGILMIAIIMGHAVTNYFQYWELGIETNIFAVIFAGIIEILMYGFIPAFYMMCGYSFRKMSIDKSVKKQFKYFWKPYMLIIFVTAIAVITKKLIISGDIIEGLRYQVLPYLFVFCPGQREFLGLYMDSIGPIWFFWVYVAAGVLLNIILQEKQFWIQCILICILGVVGISMCNIVLPFCIQQSMICCGYMFVGWVMKKQGFFSKKLPWYAILLIIITSLTGMMRGGNIEISQNVYANGMNDLVISYIVGILFMNWIPIINEIHGYISDKFRWVGKNVIYFCCIHTVVYTVVPWQKLAEVLSDEKVYGVVLEFILQLIITIIGCNLVLRCQERKRGKKNGLQNE